MSMHGAVKLQKDVVMESAMVARDMQLHRLVAAAIAAAVAAAAVVTNREEVNVLLVLLTVRRIRPAMVTSPINAWTTVGVLSPGGHLALNSLTLQVGMVVGVLLSEGMVRAR